MTPVPHEVTTGLFREIPAERRINVYIYMSCTGKYFEDCREILHVKLLNVKRFTVRRIFRGILFLFVPSFGLSVYNANDGKGLQVRK